MFGRRRQLQPHGLDTGLQGQRAVFVPLEAPLEGLIDDQSQRLVQGEESGHRRRVVIRVISAPEALCSDYIETPVRFRGLP